jgi:hypothetical protein
MSDHVTSVYHTARAGLAVLVVALLGTPGVAWAHGPIDPEASNDLAHVIHTPAGVRARVIDGDLRLWMAVTRSERVVVLDYQGGQFLRISAHGVEVNENSPMFYLNQIPPITPSIKLTPTMRPDWHRVSGGDSDEWHDGRIAALASALQAPGVRDLGRWTIPLTVDGRRATIVGQLDRGLSPSWAWLWPIVLALATLPALLRLRDAALEQRFGRPLAWLTLLAAAGASLGAGLHGRPGLSGARLAIMAVELALLVWSAGRLARRRDGPLVLAVIATVAVYRGLTGAAVLWRGYVLLAIPATLARGAIAICLAGGVSLAVIVVGGLDRGRLGRNRSSAADAGRP